MKKASSELFWQTTLALTALVTLTVLFASIRRWLELGVILYRSVWAIPLAAYLVVLTGCIIFTVRTPKSQLDKLISFLELEKIRGSAWRFIGGVLFVGVLFIIPWLKFTFRIGEVVKKSTQDPLLTTLLFYWVVWWLFLLATGALKIALQTSWSGAFATALVILGIFYEIFVRFHSVTSYLFSMGWSETSRYYYASLYFSEKIYGEQFPLSTMHPTRYLLQSLAFLVPNAGLTWHRFWQFLLWVLTTAGTSLALAKRVWKGNFQAGLLFAGWFFLFILRVGVYYHLQIMVLLILVGISTKHPWRSLLITLLASVWAGLSRINWIPVPAMLTISLHLLEQPVSSCVKTIVTTKKTHNKFLLLVKYLMWPFIWAISGLATALLVQAAYIPLSGNASNTQAFTSSFTSALLWNRLWPNDSFSLGVVPAILIISGPLMLVLLIALRENRTNLHWIRALGLLSMLVLLFAGGLIVSTKIGGGADLHNMDAYAILIGVVSAYFLFEKTQSESSPAGWRLPSWPLQAGALLIPLIFLLPSLFPMPEYNLQADTRVLQTLRRLVLDTAKDGPVLFINERHLVTFKEIDVPLVPEYENVTLMEMAMSGNETYLNRFYTDLKNHRFAAIVAGKQNTGILETGSFAEENNVWNTYVSPYIVCYYEPMVMLEASDGRIGFYVPRTVPACP